MISDLWKTPKWLKPDFTFDPCPKNPSFDGLKINWHGKVFCNPPNSEIHLWYAKALEQKKNCESIIMLLPVWSSQIWFKKIIETENVYIIPEKISFVGLYTSKGTATYKSMFVKIK